MRNRTVLSHLLSLLLFGFLISLTPHTGWSSITSLPTDPRAKVHLIRQKAAGKIASRPGLRSAQTTAAGSPAYEQTLEGQWDSVTGYIGFWHTFEEVGPMLVTVIGLPTESLGGDRYQSTGWDRKVFWMQVDDGAPIHVPAAYSHSLETEEGDLIHVFWAPNVQIRQPGVDYSAYEDEAAWMEMILYCDEDYEVLDYEVVLHDEEDEIVETEEAVMLQPGDQIRSWTLSLKMDEPDVYYISTMEDDFRPVTMEPEFSYSHLTPNVDFANTVTRDKIDFPNVDLYYLLEGGVEGANGQPDKWAYSEPKNLELRWNGSKPSRITDWMLNLVPGR